MSEYVVPPVLARIRELRARGTTGREMLDQLQPSLLWLRCEEGLGADDTAIVRALYIHAMIECGHILDGPDGDPYEVCPVCGFDFTGGA